MRSSTRMKLAVSAALSCASLFLAPAQAETLAQDAELHSRPSLKSDALAVLGAGMPVTVLDARRDGWTLVAGGGFEGYVRSGQIAPFNPWCTEGYPYSGSERYFQDGLTPVRTVPLGFLFGYHVSRPC
ncbi:SH3 domain-containing protein [Methylocystis bryophila]|nr:SH3 domain-containing protein [Methylocystis bryophila]